jgi:hypothetical protein
VLGVGLKYFTNLINILTKQKNCSNYDQMYNFFTHLMPIQFFTYVRFPLYIFLSLIILQIIDHYHALNIYLTDSAAKESLYKRPNIHHKLADFFFPGLAKPR